MTNKKSYSKILLKLWKTNEKPLRYQSCNKRRIASKIKAGKFSKAYLKVSYGRPDDVNEKTAFSLAELLLALEAFTSPNLIKYLSDE